MVDNRNLTDHKRHDGTLPHWPAAARWWHSRLKLIGPHKEKTELLFFPVSETTGLHQVHPTWAGTFVLAALVAVFPGLNFVLLDSDCLPVTLFEVEDLWTEAFLARFPVHSDVGIPKEHPLRACQRFRSDPKVQYNCGISSSHPPLFDWDDWALRCGGFPGTLPDTEYGERASKRPFGAELGNF